MGNLREREINPIIFAPVALIIVLALGYFLWLKPKMEADAALRDFNTPEAQAKRDPDRRQHTDEQKKYLEDLRAKNPDSGPVRSMHRREQ